MKQTLFLGILLLIGCQQIVFAQGDVSSKSAQILNENLKFLEPLVGKNWVGDFKSLDGKTSTKITLKYEVFWNGNVIKFSRTNPDLKFFSEGYIYWDENEKKVFLFSISNNGGPTKGDVSFEEGKIAVKGMAIIRDKKFEYKNTFEFSPDGKMVDRWFQNAFGPWRPGHVVEFIKVN